MIPSSKPSEPVVKLVFSPEASADAVLARKSVWSCNAPVSIAGVALFSFAVFSLFQGNILGAIFAFIWAAMCGLILFYSVPGAASAKRHEEQTQLYVKVVDFLVSTAKVGGVDTKKVDKLLDGQTITINNFTFIPFKDNGVAGIAVSESPAPGRPLTEEEEHDRVRKQFPEAVLIT